MNGYSPLSIGGAASVDRALKMIDRIIPPRKNNAKREKWEELIFAHVGSYFRESNKLSMKLTGLNLASLGYDV